MKEKREPEKKDMRKKYGIRDEQFDFLNKAKKEGKFDESVFGFFFFFFFFF